jgi:hypothetical protein
MSNHVRWPDACGTLREVMQPVHLTCLCSDAPLAVSAEVVELLLHGLPWSAAAQLARLSCLAHALPDPGS